MILRKYTVINYKSAKLVEVNLSSDRVNTFIGVNDCGKSTLLQGLKLFFDEKPTISFATDTSQKSVFSNSPINKTAFDNYFTSQSLPIFQGYAENLLCIHCQFEPEKEEEGLSESDELSPHLQCRLNISEPDGCIHLLRVFNNDGSKSEYYLLSEDVADEDGQPLELWNQTQANIKAAQKRFSIDDVDITNRNSVGPLKNVERILAILARQDTSSVWSKYDFKKDASIFPAVRYLDWNISSEEINQLTGEVVKPIVGRLLEPIRQQVREGSEKINTEANTQLKTLYKKYADHLPGSISGISANVNINLQPSVTELFVEKYTSDKKIHMDEQGDGIRRQIGLGLINALAQESLEQSYSGTTKKYIWCFDEPETHLFPQAQRDLATSISLLAKTQFQILVSTHSTLFVDRSELSDINQVMIEDCYTVLKSTSKTEDVFFSLGVRNSDFLFYDRFIAVEGATELGLMDHMYHLVYGTSLGHDGIQLINLRGASNSMTCKDLLEGIFRDFKKPDDMTVYLFDKDTGRSGSNVFLVGSVADFEDEISNDIWISAIKEDCGIDITADEIDALRSNISTTDSNKKLWKLLDKHISQATSQTQRLQSKGDNLAKLLKRHLTRAEDVPKSIKDAFEAVRKGLV